MSRLLHILFWSVISAAFIGPGTVTTAASAGASFDFTLLWALLFSTFACLILQEASARITIVSGKNLGQAIRSHFQEGITGILMILLVCGAIIIGCAAYEAGNILGSVAGAALEIQLSPKLLTLTIGILAGMLLYWGTTKTIAQALGIVVALMGIVFLVTAFLLKPSLTALLKGAFLPALPGKSGLLVLGLIGTTVVPYNLFLGSSIASGQKLSELRFGLSIAIILGGIISMGVLVVGTSIIGNFSFQGLSDALSTQLGSWAGLFFAFGLFAAGFSSAITAPLAAALTARSLFEKDANPQWHEHSWRYRAVWLGVLGSGLFFGMLNIKPVPVIILVQALNGILLPFVAIFLFLLINDRRLMGEQGINHLYSNIGMGAVLILTIIMGISNISRAITSALKLPMPGGGELLIIGGVIAVILIIPVIRGALQRR